MLAEKCSKLMDIKYLENIMEKNKRVMCKTQYHELCEICKHMIDFHLSKFSKLSTRKKKRLLHEQERILSEHRNGTFC